MITWASGHNLLACHTRLADVARPGFDAEWILAYLKFEGMGDVLEITLSGAECSPREKEREPVGADPFAVLRYGTRQQWVAKLIKGSALTLLRA